MLTRLTLLYLCSLVLGWQTLVAQRYNVYYGNIHAHTSYSDGCKDSAETGVKTPADAFRFARESAHLDFLGISEHNHSQAGMQLASYAKGLADADALNENGRFVCLYGMEYGVISKGGHIVIYGSDKLIGWERNNYDVYSAKSDYASLFRILAANPHVFATLAHPEPTHFSDLAAQGYNLTADQAICGVAISSGPAFSKKTDYSDKPSPRFYSYYKTLLSKGYIVGPTIDHDNHNTTFGRMSATRTAVLAQTLHRDSIIAAYKANRFYATEDWNVKVDFTLNGMPLGSYSKNKGTLQLTVTVTDPDPTDAIKSIKVLYGKPGTGQMPTVLARSATDTLSKTVTLAPGNAFYYYVEIVQQDGDRIYTSPIWAKN